MKIPGPPRVEVNVLSGGSVLPEYNDDDDERNGDDVGVKYVEATSGSEFTISIDEGSPRASAGNEPDVLCVDLHLDGMCVESGIVALQEIGRIAGIISGKADVVQKTVQSFKFADVETSKLRVLQTIRTNWIRRRRC